MDNVYAALFLVAFVGILILIDKLRLIARRRDSPIPDPGPPRPAPTPTPPPAPPPDPDEVARVAVVRLHNIFRSQRGKRLLEIDQRLSRSAQGHAEHMAKHHVLGHMLIGDGDPFGRMKAAGFEYSKAAENIAEGQPTPEEVCKAWEGDFLHRVNMEGDYTRIGVGLARTESGTPYWCVDFGTPL